MTTTPLLEVQTAVAPLMEFCRRTNRSLPDNAGLRRLQNYEPDAISRAVRHVIAQARQSDAIRSPFGLLIATLDSGSLPDEPHTPLAPTSRYVETEPEPEPIDPDHQALAELLAVHPDFWSRHVSSLYQGPSSRLPNGNRMLIARLVAVFREHPHLIISARQYLGSVSERVAGYSL